MIFSRRIFFNFIYFEKKREGAEEGQREVGGQRSKADSVVTVESPMRDFNSGTGRS